ncbi:MAG: LuxR C-terminal-related transcriptional regulator [Planctomycetaceae bacterium]
MNMDDLWLVLKSQPGVGVLIIDCNGRVLFCNDQAKRIYYGNQFNPVGLTIEEIEGPEFAAERMPVIHSVIETGKPMLLRHVRGGRHTEALIWPMQNPENPPPRVMSITRQLFETDESETSDNPYPCVDSHLVDLGPLDVLTKREIEVLAMVGHGVPLKSVAKELGIAQRTVERYRTDIARKLNLNSIAEIARVVQIAGLKASDADLPRLHRWRDSSGGSH